MKAIKSINKVTATNIVSTAILQGFSFLTIPLFTRILGASQYGLYSVYNSWVLIVTCIMGLGTGSVLGMGMYAFKGEYYRFRSSTLLLGTLTSLLVMALMAIFAPLISKRMGYNIPTMGIILIVSFAHYVVSFFQGACVYEKKAVDNFVVSLLVAVSTTVLSLLLITKFQWKEKYLGRVYGEMIPYVIISVVLWIKIFFREKTGLRSIYSRFALSTGFPLVFHSLAHNILGQSDRVMMQLLGLPSSEIGIYSMFYSLSMVLNTILSALNTSWCSFYYEDLDAQAWEKLDKKCKNYIELFTVLTVGFILLVREVAYILADESYRSGLGITPILVFAVYFIFMYQFPVNFELFHRKTKTVALGTITSGVLNIILNGFMIPVWGMYGAAVATLLSYGALFVMHYGIVKNMKEHPFHIKATAFVPGVLCTIGAVFLYYALEDMWYLRWCMGAIIGIIEVWRIYRRKTIF